MIDDNQAAKELEEFAETLVWRLVRRYGLNWGSHRREDVQYDLFVAGWEDWRETGNLGFARQRMSSRSVNVIRDESSRRQREPMLDVDRRPSDDEESSGVDRYGSYVDDPAKAMIEAEEIDRLTRRLTDRQRRILRFRYAGLTHAQISEEMGVPVRTIQREWSRIQKEMENV